MRTALTAITDELKRLRTAGVKSVAVSEESLAALRRVVMAQGKKQDRKPEAIPVKPMPSPSASSEGGEKGRDGPLGRPVGHAPAEVIRGGPSPDKSGLTGPALPKIDLLAAPKLPPPPVVVLPAGDKATRWAALRDQVLGHPVCTANIRPGKKIVMGIGSLDAKIMFVGDAPDADEEITGEPFVGPAGQLLTKMIAAMGLKREEVYIGSIMNWRPAMPTPEGVEQVGNRAPTPEEMAFCLPFLRAQIEIVNPDVIVALGSIAAQGLLGAGSFKTLGEIRGTWKQFERKPVLVTYHPSYILRTNSNRSKRMIWEDLLQVMERVTMPVSERQRGYFLER